MEANKQNWMQRKLSGLAGGVKSLLGKPKTRDYKGIPLTPWGMSPRDLPLFNFQMVYAMLWDPTIKLGLAMREAPIVGLEFAYKDGETWTPGVKAEKPQVAEYVYGQLQRIWKYDIHKLLRAQVWGWAAGEVTYRMNKIGQVEVDRIETRHAIDTRALEREGELSGVRFRRVNDINHVDLDFPKAIWHAFRPEDGKHYGNSVLRGCYSPWADKCLTGMALDVRRLYMHKDAYAGMVIGHPNETYDGPDGVVRHARDIAREMVEQCKAGHVIVKPNVYDVNSNPLWTVERPTSGSNAEHILNYPKDLDREILRGLEIPDDVLTSDGDSSGAWAGKQVPQQAFYTGLDLWVGMLVGDIVHQIMDPLVELNFGCKEEYEVSHKPLAVQSAESEAKQEQAKRPPQVPGFGQPAGMPGQPNNPQGPMAAAQQPGQPGGQAEVDDGSEGGGGFHLPTFRLPKYHPTGGKTWGMSLHERIAQEDGLASEVVARVRQQLEQRRAATADASVEE